MASLWNYIISSTWIHVSQSSRCVQYRKEQNQLPEETHVQQPCPPKFSGPSWSAGMHIPDLPGILGQNKILSLYTGNSQRGISHTVQKLLFVRNQKVPVVTVKSYLPKVKLSSFPFKGHFHFLLSLQPLESCRWHRYIKNPTKP